MVSQMVHPNKWYYQSFYDYPCYAVLPRRFVVQLSKRTIRDSTDSLKAYVSIFLIINQYSITVMDQHYTELF